MSEMKKYTKTEIILDLIGSFSAYGETNHDDRSLDNLDVVSNVLDALCRRLYLNARNTDSYMHSVAEIAKKSKNILQCTAEWGEFNEYYDRV